MFPFKVCTLLSLVLVASATDLDNFLQQMECSKRALTEGVDALNISSIEPSVNLSESYSWTGTILFTEVTVNLSDLVLSNGANFNVSATQLSKDEDATAVFDFELSWDWLGLDGAFYSEANVGIVKTIYNGTVKSNFTGSKFIGSLNFTKPNYDAGNVEDIQINWHVESVNIDISGLSIVAEPIEVALEASVKTALNNNLIGNVLGNILKENLQNYWFSTGKYWRLMDWCEFSQLKY